MSKIIICGDLLPTEVNMKQFENGDIESLLSKDIISFFQKADYRISNLEGCYTDSNHPIEKSGPNLKASVKAFSGFKKIGFDLVGMANNHVMDYGAEGLFSTFDLLEKANIASCGAGYTLSEAYQPHFFTINNTKVGVIALAEYEFTIATSNTPGAACFDDLETPDLIANTKRQVDYLIVLYHGGKEYYRYPTPYVQKRCRKMVEKGADLVITQHSHCIGCEEKYQNGTIIYGQGNFLFSRGGDSEFRDTGLMISVDLTDRTVTYDVVVKNGAGVRLATEEEASTILFEVSSRSKEIINEGFVDAQYREFASSNLSHYQIQSLGRVAGVLEKLKILKIISKLYERKNMINLLNVLRCEAHRDLYIRGLTNKLYSENNGSDNSN